VQHFTALRIQSLIFTSDKKKYENQENKSRRPTNDWGVKFCADSGSTGELDSNGPSDQHSAAVHIPVAGIQIVL
jgi:hypothetical protein